MKILQVLAVLLLLINAPFMRECTAATYLLYIAYILKQKTVTDRHVQMQQVRTDNVK